MIHIVISTEYVNLQVDSSIESEKRKKLFDQKRNILITVIAI